MIGSADRAEQAVKLRDVAIPRMEDLARRIDRGLHRVGSGNQKRDSALESWTYFTVGVIAGTIGGLVVLVISSLLQYVASLL